MSSAIPSTSRSHDKFYMYFLISYAATIVFFDSVPLYPPNFVPARLLSAQEYYKNFFNDQLVIAQPPWFHLFSLIELLYQLPLVLWGIWALATKSPRAPAHLLVWSVVCFGTTVTCIYEFYHHQMMSETQKTRLIAMYGLYALIFAIVGADMFCRIQKTLDAAASLGNEKKQR
ncbi:hypothetical protein L208DRAFT_1389217 [Tricholoma matsutake]|nr:hypothetical protein L208DRAFT_1389217 [Tricholoma matsutake 945]